MHLFNLGTFSSPSSRPNSHFSLSHIQWSRMDSQPRDLSSAAASFAYFLTICTFSRYVKSSFSNRKCDDQGLLYLSPWRINSSILHEGLTLLHERHPLHSFTEPSERGKVVQHRRTSNIDSRVSVDRVLPCTRCESWLLQVFPLILYVNVRTKSLFLSIQNKT